MKVNPRLYIGLKILSYERVGIFFRPIQRVITFVKTIKYDILMPPLEELHDVVTNICSLRNNKVKNYTG